MSVTEQELRRRPQEEVGDPDKYQALLRDETVPVPDYLKPATADLGTGGIPTERYTSAEFHRREVEKLWPKVWQLVCREEQVQDPGDTVLYELTDQSVFVMRGNDGQLRGFYNSCLHRGLALRETEGCAGKIKCPFHGFTWDINGKFQSLPCAWDFEHLNKAELDLPQVRVETWGGFVFLNFDENAPPLLDYLECLPEHFANYNMDRSCTLIHVRRELPCNWKAAQEAFFESMHSLVTHPQIVTFIDDADTQYDILGRHINRMITPSTEPSPHLADCPPERVVHDSLVGSGRMAETDGDAHKLPPGTSPRQFIGEMNREAFAAATGDDLSRATLSELQDAILYHVFPNTQIWAGYFGNILYRFIPNGDDHNSCIFDVRLLGRHPAGSERPKAPPMILLPRDQPFSSIEELGALGPVFDQDVSNMGRMQKGMRASKKGRIDLARYQEVRIRHNHQTLDEYLNAD